MSFEIKIVKDYVNYHYDEAHFMKAVAHASYGFEVAVAATEWRFARGAVTEEQYVDRAVWRQMKARGM